MRLLPVLALLSSVVLELPVGSANATVADDLCAPTDDPCVVSGEVTITPGSTIDLGGRGLDLTATAKVFWTGTVMVTNAGTCDFAAGSLIRESDATPGNPLLWLYCSSARLSGTIKTAGAGVLVEGSAPTDGPYAVSGTIQAKGDQVGVIAIDAIGGDITVSGSIKAQSKTGTPPGEFRLISNFGDVVIEEKAKIQLKGATADPFTEFFIIEAGTGTVTINGKIDARTKTGAYALNLEANQALELGVKAKINASGKGTGPEVAINSQVASVTLRGQIQAKTSKVTMGNGSRVRVCAGNDVTIAGSAKIDASAGYDGSIIVGAFDTAQVSSGATLSSKKNGDIEVCGGTSGFVSSHAKVSPEATAVGTYNDAGCLSPESQVLFDLDCNAGQ